MCQHFCCGGIILIIVFTIVFTIAVYLNLRQEFSKTPPPPAAKYDSEVHPRSFGVGGSDFNQIKTNKFCEPLLLYSVTNGEREKLVPKTNETLPIVVQLNYRIKDNRILNLCNGVVIHPHYILTLAECLIDNSNKELISVTTNPTQNASVENYKIIDISIYDINMNQSFAGADNIGLIQIENGFKMAKQYCTRQLSDRGEEFSSVWNEGNLVLATCSSTITNWICMDGIRAANRGDPLVVYDNGNWNLIGLHQGYQFIPHEATFFINVNFYRNWITNTV